MQTHNIHYRKLEEQDIPIFYKAFKQASWEKPIALFEKYLQEQNSSKREVFVAYSNDNPSGYVTLKWISEYEYFKEKNIPEIVDLNVLPHFRRQGVGKNLLLLCEKYAFNESKMIGVGVGLYRDYGPAQIMYILSGYVPDCQGVTYDRKPVKPGDQVRLDDDLNLWLIKRK